MNATRAYNDRLFAFYREGGAYALEITTTRAFCSLKDAGTGLAGWMARGGRLKDCAIFRNVTNARGFLKTIQGDIRPADLEKMNALLG